MKSLSSLFGAVLFALGATALVLSPANAQTVDPQTSSEPPQIIRKPGGVLMQGAVTRVEPTYPPLANAARVSGVVIVEVTIDEQGSVISARAISGHPLLKDAAVAAARRWKFSPTILSGAPVKVIGTISFNFQAAAPYGDPWIRTRLELLRRQLTRTRFPRSSFRHRRNLDDDEARKRSGYKDARQTQARFREGLSGLGELSHFESFAEEIPLQGGFYGFFLTP